MRAWHAAVATAVLSTTAQAQVVDSAQHHQDTAFYKLAPIEINARRTIRLSPLQMQTFPVVSSVVAERTRETVNLIDTEDAVKYLPSIFLRKRNQGDTQATLATRVWGTSSSARTLVFADGIPLSALIANNNTIGGPRWGLISPAEIARVDVMYGPYAAAYAGNSMGGVLEITTRLPEKLEGSISLTEGLQHFDLYGTNDNYATTQVNGYVGQRFGKLAVWASGNYQKSKSQPLSYVTSATFPSGTSGGFDASNKLNAPANVVGASGLLDTEMTNVRVKLAYDLSSTLQATYAFGLWRGDSRAGTNTYLANSVDAQPTFAGLSGFASGTYDWQQQHTAHSVILRTETQGSWDFDVVASRYRFDKDEQRLPTGPAPTDTTFGAPGRSALLSGTGWSSLDAKGLWRASARQTVSFGGHVDRYVLDNPTYNTGEWQHGEATSLATSGSGKTRTAAFWLQHSWQALTQFKLTAGVRYEDWRAFDGVNINGATKVTQPDVNATRWSPKLTLAWTPAEWLVNASMGKAYRFPTTAELYQLVSTGTTFTSPAPDLKPDNDLSSELRVERQFEHARAQLSLFQEDVHDAIISQFLPLVPGSTTLYSYLANVDHIRARGVEAVAALHFMSGLEVTGNVTYVNAKTLAISGRASATAPAGSAVGKRVPNIPDWRLTGIATFRPHDRFALSLAGRYSGKIYTTLDNADVNPNTYQGFSSWFVLDTHAHWRATDRWALSGGVDNILDRKYFLFHPFPQRTFVASAEYSL